jgi:hypothetical protein
VAVLELALLEPIEQVEQAAAVMLQEDLLVALEQLTQAVEVEEGLVPVKQVVQVVQV